MHRTSRTTITSKDPSAKGVTLLAALADHNSWVSATALASAIDDFHTIEHRALNYSIVVASYFAT